MGDPFHCFPQEHPPHSEALASGKYSLLPYRLGRRSVSWDKTFSGRARRNRCYGLASLPYSWRAPHGVANHFRNGQSRIRALEFGRHQCPFVTERRRVNGDPGNLPAAKSQWLRRPPRACECAGAAWSSGKEEEPMSPGKSAAERAERWKGYED